MQTERAYKVQKILNSDNDDVVNDVLRFATDYVTHSLNCDATEKTIGVY